MVLREIISLFQPMESILLALAGVSSRPAGNVSVDQHPTYRFSNGCLFSSFLRSAPSIFHPFTNTYYLQI